MKLTCLVVAVSTDGWLTGQRYSSSSSSSSRKKQCICSVGNLAGDAIHLSRVRAAALFLYTDDNANLIVVTLYWERETRKRMINVQPRSSSFVKRQHVLVVIFD